jgi:hypothetical protein
MRRSREKAPEPRLDPMPNATDLVASVTWAPDMIKQVDDYFFGAPVIRQDWSIHAKYDLTDLKSKGVIIEELNWSYELMNIGAEELFYNLSLLADPDLEGKGGLISFNLIENGKRVPIPLVEVTHSGVAFTNRRRDLWLAPMKKYKTELWYRQRWPVNKDQPLIHNTFMPRETSYKNRLTLESEDLKSVGVAVSLQEIRPHTPTSGCYIFDLPEIMLRHQGVEVLLKFYEPLKTDAAVETPTKRQDSSKTCSGREKVFISYSHRDKRIFNEFNKMLAPLLKSTNIDAWDDTKIRPGAEWKEEIKQALGAAKIGVLLVSQDYLTSRFIISHELAPLLDAAGRNGVTIFWVCLRPCTYEETEIAKYQAAHDPARPLSKLNKTDREDMLKQICQMLTKIHRGIA